VGTVQVTIVVGNPKRASRTLEVARAVAGDIFVDGSDIDIVELADYASEVFSWASTAVDELTARVSASDVLVVASPTYKATYTGLLKAFLDRYQADGLARVVAVAVMTGADKTHALGGDMTLVPLLNGLGATVLGRGSYFVTDDMTALPEFAATEGARYRASIEQVARLQSVTRPSTDTLAHAPST
jgi:FMN reductase